MSSSIKGPAPATTTLNGSDLRIGIVHARWNKTVIDALLAGALARLKELGVREDRIVVESVPGSFELPLGCKKVIAASQMQRSGSSAMTDLLSLSITDPIRSSTPLPPSTPFDAVIAIGVLIKGSTAHFEYISSSVSSALMQLQMETGTPVIFGVLTAFTDEQALERAGLGDKGGHNHGKDWADAAVEMGAGARRWAKGELKEYSK